MKIGYARTSMQDRNLDWQVGDLEKVGCEKIYREAAAGVGDRPELAKMLEQLRPGDVIVIQRFDRLARSITDLIRLINQIQEKGASLQSLEDEIDTVTSQGESTFHLFEALAQFERNVIRERTKVGLSAARARGRKGGRPAGLSEKAQQKAIIAEQLYTERKLSIPEICQQLSISKSTLYKYLHYRGVKFNEKPS